jgi:hypothetical protein
MKFLAYQDNRSPLCPSCLFCNKTCKHIAQCPEAGLAAAFAQSTQDVKRWLADHHTQPNLKLLLLHYLRGRGTTTCLECLDNLNLPHIFRDFAVSQDVIGWDGFTTGMVSTTLLPQSKTHFHTVADHHPMLCGGSLGLSPSYCKSRTPNGFTNVSWYTTVQQAQSYQRTRRSYLKRSNISSTSARMASMSRIDSN